MSGEIADTMVMSPDMSVSGLPGSCGMKSFATMLLSPCPSWLWMAEKILRSNGRTFWGYLGCAADLRLGLALIRSRPDMSCANRRAAAIRRIVEGRTEVPFEQVGMRMCSLPSHAYCL